MAIQIKGKIANNITFFWLPRALSCLIIILCYKIFHLSADLNIAPKSPFVTPDFNVYENSFRFNPLFAAILQSANALPYSGASKLIFSFLASGFAQLSIQESAQKIFPLSKKRNRLISFLLAVHPFLCLYSLKFCTENFLLIGIALFLRKRATPKITKKQSKYKVYNLFSGVLTQISIFLCRAQSFPLLAYETVESLKELISTSTQQRSAKLIIKFSSTVLVTVLVTLILFTTSKDYIIAISENLWDGAFPIKPADIYRAIGGQETSNILQNIFNVFCTIAIYSAIAIITLLGGRGRTTDMPWVTNVGTMQLRNFLYPAQELTSADQSYMTQISSPQLQTEIFLKIIIPLAIFSIVHLIGTIRWIRSIKQSPKLFSLSYSI